MKKGNKSFAIVLRGSPDNFMQVVEQAKAAGLYVVYTKSSYLKLVVQEVPF